MLSDNTILAAKVISITGPIFCAGFNVCAGHTVVPRLCQEPVSSGPAIFTHVFKTGSIYVIPTAFLSVGTSLLLAYTEPDRALQWGLAALSVLVTGPFTGLYMYPGIKRLGDIAGDTAMQRKAGETGEHIRLMKSWNRQGDFRASLFLAGGVLGVYASLR